MQVQLMNNVVSDRFVVALMRLVGMDLLDFVDAFVERTINRSSDCERTTNDSAQANKETGEGLVAHFPVDDLHWRDILRRVSYAPISPAF